MEWKENFGSGLIGSLILAIVPALLSETHGEQRGIALSESNVIASLVATGGPLLVGLFASSLGNWRYALGLVAISPIFIYLIFGRGVRIAEQHVPRGSAQDAGAHVPFGADQPLSLRYWIFWVAIVLAVSIEFCMISWSADFLEKVIGMQKDNAVQAVSLFFIAMIIGRYLGSVLVRRFSIYRLLLVDLLVAAAGFLFFWKSGILILALGGLFVTGLGIASTYPLILTLAIGAAGKNTVQASARATLASGIAILALPLVLGRLADTFGIALAYGVVVILLLSDFLIIFYEQRSASPKRSSS